jgi:hypothetical protein
MAVTGCEECDQAKRLVEAFDADKQKLEDTLATLSGVMVVVIVMGGVLAKLFLDTIELLPEMQCVVAACFLSVLLAIFFGLIVRNLHRLNKISLSLWGFVCTAEKSRFRDVWHLHESGDTMQATQYVRLFLGRHEQHRSCLVLSDADGSVDDSWRVTRPEVAAKSSLSIHMPMIEVQKFDCPETWRSVQLDRDL